MMHQMPGSTIFTIYRTAIRGCSSTRWITPEPSRHGRSTTCARTAKGLTRSSGSSSNTPRRKTGHDQDIRAFCSGLVALRPVPIVDLSAVTDLSEPQIRDLCADLAPGVRLTNGAIGFADEDFEHFIRTEAEAQLGLSRRGLPTTLSVGTDRTPMLQPM